jgi:hypothetical protein
MEIVQTGMDTWPRCMGMFGARFAVFVRRARVLPTPCPATRNLSFLRFHRHRHPVVSTRGFTGNGTGWCENSTRWKSHKRVHAPLVYPFTYSDIKSLNIQVVLNVCDTFLGSHIQKSPAASSTAELFFLLFFFFARGGG